MINFYQNQDHISFWAVTLSLLFLAATLAIWGLNFNKLPSELPLFYSLSWGQKQLGSNLQFLVLPAMSTLVLLANLIISWQLHPSQYALKRILTISAMVAAILVFITALKIVFIFI